MVELANSARLISESRYLHSYFFIDYAWLSVRGCYILRVVMHLREFPWRAFRINGGLDSKNKIY